jgi:parallel beta-helix repeat protein
MERDAMKRTVMAVLALLWLLACGAAFGTVYVNRDYYYDEYNQEWRYSIVERHYSSSVTWGQYTDFGHQGMGGPYVLESSVYIDSGGVLNVEPGVTVNTKQHCGIYVQGTLNAQGTASQHITFTSSEGAARGSWREIYFVGAGSSGSVLRYCDIRYAGPWENLYMFEHWHNSAGVVGGIDSAPTIDHCDISTATQGIRFIGSSHPTVTNCTITNCDYAMVFNDSSYYSGYGPTPPISGNTVTNCDAAAYCQIQVAGAFAADNNFHDNIHNVIRIEGSSVQNCSRMRKLAGNPVWEIQGDTYCPALTSLTVDAGCVVKMKDGCSIWNLGTLIVAGTSTDKVYFTSWRDDTVGGDTNPEDGALPAKGDWADLLFVNDTSNGSTVNNCVLRYGGRIANIYDLTLGWHCQRSNIVCWNASPTVRNTLSTKAAGDGAFLIGNSRPTFENVEFTLSNGWAINCADTEANPCNAGCSASGNGANAVRIPSATLGGSRTWYKSIPYWLDGNVWLAANATLVVQPGAAVKAPANAGFYIAGNLQAIGTSAEPIYFTSCKDDIYGDSNADGSATAPAPGDWADLDLFSTSASPSVLDHCVVRYGGCGDNDYGEDAWHNRSGNIHIRNCSPIVRNSIIERSLHYGIYANGGCQATLQNNTINNNDWGIVVKEDGLYGDGAPRVTGNTFTGNNRVGSVSAQAMNQFAADNLVIGNISNGLQIYNSTVQTTANWRRMLGTSTLVAAGDIVVPPGTALNIAPASVVKIMPGVSIRAQGTITANGTSTGRIYFTSWKDDTIDGDTNADPAAPAPADWHAIVCYGPGSSASSFKNCEVRYGSTSQSLYTEIGWLNYNGNIIMSDSNATLEDVALKYGGQYGLVMLGSSRPVLTRVSMAGNANYAAYMAITANAAMTDCSASGNGANGIYMEPGSLNDARTWHKSVPYVVTGHISVESNAVLTVNPGTVVKFRPGTGLYVAGNMQAISTDEQNRIYFTAFTDDEVGGDTDAQQVSPTPGYWKEVCFYGGGASASVLKGCTFRYAGNQAPECVGPGWHDSIGNVGVFDQACPTFTSCVFSNSRDAGIYLSDNAPAQIVNCDIHHNSRGIYTDVAYTSAMQPAAIRGCHVHQNTSHAFDVQPNTSVNIAGDNDVVDNTLNWVNVRPGSLSTSGTWNCISNGLCPFRMAGSVGVGTTAILSINPGVVVKFARNATLGIQGGLRAVGTNQKRIYFTAEKDDTLGGDSNGDGETTGPTPGYYNDVLFMPSLATEVAYCGFRYGGSSIGSIYDYGFWRNPVGCVYVVDSAVLFDHCDFAFSGSDGLVSRSADLTLNNCTLANNNLVGLYTFLGSDCTLNSCVAHGNPYAATQVNGEDGDSITASYCDLVGTNYLRAQRPDAPGCWDWIDSYPTGVGNFVADPIFVNAAAGAFNLKPVSPLINAGDPSKNDPNGTRLDVGAYPFDGVWNPVSIAVAKTSPNGTPLLISGAVATGGATELGGMIYIEDESRISGIRIDSPVASKAGDKISVAGELGLVNGERAIVNAEVSVVTGAFEQPKPWLMNGKNVGGASKGYTPGIPGGSGAHNIGLLVVVTGRVAEPGSGFFYVNDGSASDGRGLKVYSGASVSAGQTVRVRGISSTELIGGVLTPVIRTRTLADVQ